jgi:hypothetical protein
VIGKDGQELEKLHQTADVDTLHGIIARGFPNTFWTGPPQGVLTANQTFCLDVMCEQAAYILRNAEEKARKENGKEAGTVVIEASAEAVEKWGDEIASHALAQAPMAGCTPG